jgi:hypothetical protein
VNRPAETLLGRSGEQDVFLVVVEVLERQAALTLAERRVCRSRRVRLERAEIVLQPGDQYGMLQARGAAQRLKRVGEHRAVDLAVVGLGVLARPRREEQVRGVHAGDRGVDGLRVEDVAVHMLDPGNLVAWFSGQADDAPAGGHERLGSVVSGDTGHAHDECGAVHGVPSLRSGVRGSRGHTDGRMVPCAGHSVK